MFSVFFSLSSYLFQYLFPIFSLFLQYLPFSRQFSLLPLLTPRRFGSPDTARIISSTLQPLEWLCRLPITAAAVTQVSPTADLETTSRASRRPRRPARRPRHPARRSWHSAPFPPTRCITPLAPKHTHFHSLILFRPRSFPDDERKKSFPPRRF